MDWTKLKPIELSKIKSVDFPTDQYYQIETDKTQIVLHHTVSDPNKVEGDINTWLGDPAHVATHFIIDGKGIPYQCYSSKYWAHHLGVTKDILKNNGFTDLDTRNVLLNEHSIAIEIDNWGYLDKTPEGKYKTYYGNVLTNPDVQEYPNLFREKRYYQKYTEAQIQTVGEILLFFHQKFGIPLDYHDKMWDMSKDALSGVPGIWTHVSYRPDKSDCHPQPELIEMLKTLKTLV